METVSEMGKEEEGKNPCGPIAYLHLALGPQCPHTVLFMLDDLDLELRLARFEQLMERRPLLLNGVLLRQNPHNVHEWHKRVTLYKGKPREVSLLCRCCFMYKELLFLPLYLLYAFLLFQIINTYTEAVQTVTPAKATGKPHSLWVAFAKFYEDNVQIEDVSYLFLLVCLFNPFPKCDVHVCRKVRRGVWSGASCYSATIVSTASYSIYSLYYGILNGTIENTICPA